MAVSTNVAQVTAGAWTLLGGGAASAALAIQAQASPVLIAYGTSPPATFSGLFLAIDAPPFLAPPTAANIYATAAAGTATVIWTTAS